MLSLIVNNGQALWGYLIGAPSEAFSVEDGCVLQIQQIQMRNRYFSPDSIPNSGSLNVSSGNNGRLRWMGSTSKLQTCSSVLMSEPERKIGCYTYDVSRQIGSGYSSKVYKGRCNRDDSDCAVKVIELKKYSESSLKMLDNEIQILKTLDHPNVIKCFEVHKTPTHCYIVTEYCSNGDLLTYLARRGKLQESVAAEVMAQIIEGVKYLLSKGILHRDLKPANILNNRKNWKIADFGFAIYSEGQIKTKYNVGTPLYMPLQALVKNVYSPLSDIFSIGVIFYELLTGITPWECKNQKQLIKKMTNLPYSLAERHKISASTKNILEKLCAIQPDKRTSKEEFIALKFKKDSENPEQRKCGAKVVLQRSHSEFGEEILLKSTSNLTLGHNRPGSSDKPVDGRLQTRNNHILINQLHYCRFIYYLTRNLCHLRVGAKSLNKMTLILYKHLQKLIKNLADEKHNWFHLKNWDNFKESKKYYTTHLTMKEYSVRYEKEYLSFLKQTDLATIRQINKELTELSSPDAFSINFYRNLLSTLAPIIREANHNLTLALGDPTEALTPELKAAIQALKSLFKYYKLNQISLTDFQNFESFQRKSDIKVQIDYRSAPNVTIEQFAELRKELKFI